MDLLKVWYNCVLYKRLTQIMLEKKVWKSDFHKMTYKGELEWIC